MPTMSLGETVAPGAWDFFGAGVGLGLGLSSGLGEALGEGLGVTLGSGVGEAFFLCLPLGEGDGELVGFGLGVSDASGVGLGVGLFFAKVLFFFGEALGEGSGVAFSFGEGLAEGSGVGFFFGDALGDGVGEAFFLWEAFRFFGGGVGSKMRLIFVPKSCCPWANCTIPPAISAATIRIGSARTFAREINAPAPAAPLCSSESRRRSFPVESSR